MLDTTVQPVFKKSAKETKCKTTLKSIIAQWFYLWSVLYCTDFKLKSTQFFFLSNNLKLTAECPKLPPCGLDMHRPGTVPNDTTTDFGQVFKRLMLTGENRGRDDDAICWVVSGWSYPPFWISKKHDAICQFFVFFLFRPFLGGFKKQNRPQA